MAHQECSADFVLEQLHVILDRCMDPSKFDWRGAVKVLELFGKHVGLFNDRQEAIQSSIDKLDRILEQLREE